jgi:hypothetical protein
MSDNMPEDVLAPESLKRALKAFKKRLKLTRLDAESTLGGGPFSGGRSSGIVAIQPPSIFPRQVWDRLVELGKLRRVQGGLYELSQDAEAVDRPFE